VGETRDRDGFFGACFRTETVKRALYVALVVGTALNLINHYDVVLGGSVSPGRIVQMVLTYIVPYLVSTHGQVSAIGSGASGP